MPKTRRDIDRDHKVEEVLTVAERQLLAGGYPALSMVGVARDLGVAQNSIYWYFPTKDHLFVAVLRRLLSRMVARKPPAERGLVDQAVWMVNRLADFHGLGIAVHERARTSALVARFNDEFQAMLRNMLVGALRPHLSEAELDLAASAFISTVEGAFLRGVSRREREAIVRFTLEKITGDAPPRVSGQHPRRRAPGRQ